MWDQARRWMRHDVSMQEVEVIARSPELLAEILTPSQARVFDAAGRRARSAFGDRTIWHVNATAHGGGVAEMLQTLLAYGRAAQIDNQWRVLDGSPSSSPSPSGSTTSCTVTSATAAPLGELERACYERVLAANLDELRSHVGARDVVVLHDPQTAGMVDGLRATGARVAWRCHVGRDAPNEQTESAWAFLRPYIESADAFVFSRREYAPDWVEPNAPRHHPALDRSVLRQEPRPR